jgi:acetylornithine deacetylase/succinyl-diaminopimelate desuccinylase family protein
MTMFDQALRNRLLDTVSAYRDDMIALTEALVAVPMENPPGTNYAACVEVLARKLHELGIEHTVVEVPSAVARDRLYVLGAHGPGRDTLYFHGHYDVVPVNDPGQFRPRRRGGILFGRGSTDMKGGLAAMIYALLAVKKCQAALDGRIGLVLVPDEETGGAGGSGYLSAAGLIGHDGVGMLTAEPTAGVIWNANRGAVSLRVTIHGKPAHVGLHYTGVNAFEQMLDVVRRLRELKAEVETRRTSAAAEPEAARRSILLLGGECTAGKNFNVVPGLCSFTLDRRINPEEDLAVEKQRLLAIFESAQAAGIELDVEVFQEGESASSPPDGRLAKALVQSAQEVTGRPPTFAMCPGLLETRFYARRGVPAYAYGPGLLTVSHGPHEFIKVRDLVACSAVYALTAVRLLQKDLV